MKIDKKGKINSNWIFNGGVPLALVGFGIFLFLSGEIGLSLFSIGVGVWLFHKHGIS